MGSVTDPAALADARHLGEGAYQAASGAVGVPVEGRAARHQKNCQEAGQSHKGRRRLGASKGWRWQEPGPGASRHPASPPGSYLMAVVLRRATAF